MTIIGLAITCGMNSAMSTLVSQAFGAKNMRLCGIYYNQARIMVAILFVPIAIVLLNSDHLFRAIGFEEHICQHALTFITYKLPHLFFFSIYDATKRLVYNTGYQKVPMYIQMVTGVLHPFWCYLFVDIMDIGIRGPALAASVSQIFNMTCMSIYLGRIEDFKEMWFMPNAECFKGLTNYIKIGLPSMGLIWLEWCAFEFLTFMSGYLDVDSTAAQIVLMNLEQLVYMPAWAFMTAAAAVVGKSIGEGNAEKAKYLAKAAQVLTLIETSIQVVIIICFRHYIAEFYTNVPAVQVLAEKALIIIAFG